MPAEARPGEPYPGPVLDLLAAAGDRTVFEHGARAVSGARMLGLVRRVAAGLRAAGLGPGDGVALRLGVTPEAFAAVIAGHVVGARVVGVRPGLPPAQLRHVLHQDVTAVVADDGTGTLALADLLATPDEGGRPQPSGRPGDVARLLYTSGSTGTPKACAQTYAAMSAAWTARPEAWPPAIRELASRLRRYLVFGSLSSQVMMEYGVLTLAAGGTMVVADPPAFPEAITGLGATASVITVPRLYQLVAAQRRRPADLSSLRALMVSGSPLAASRLREALDVLGPVVFHGYGQTETGTISMATPWDVPPSVGFPPDVVDVVVRGPDGRPVPPGVDGELYVRTPAQAAGYWNDPGRSAEVFVDGWVRTRDLGHFDADGRLYLTGRTRDVVIVNANLYYTGPIERVLAAAPGVAEAYVVAAPDEETGEAAHAFVVPAADRVPDLDALRELVGERLGGACVPATITVVDEVPVGPGGKPDKRLLLPAIPRPEDGPVRLA
ncbi:fatty acid--CoA ligase family protein [Actinomadura sp. ATCC 31491]|uniref:Long-chain-fatty-acid--CoA ligase n=1 Tax=Actinomadura luzonensis TaxID=2805427 RepID=A0ABT0G743_9ACTN|nr:fatty acid--CoA ligase family protein [Actinomadura luzonensis]MCK2220421.1 fatty acid--CoA ligase family protein [Actinomadura luzonensis]